MSAARILLAGGGTGGHLYPGVAVATQIRRLSPDAQVTFITTDRPLDRQILEPTGFEQLEQPVRPWSASPTGAVRCALAWWRSLRRLRSRFDARPPDAVLGLGGYAAGPALSLGRRWKARVAMLNPDATPGKANRWLARHCDLIVTQWDVTLARFAGLRHAEAWGCPIRDDFRHPPDRSAAATRFGLDPDRPILVVTGASQGARTVNEALLRAWPEFHRRHAEWQLLHLTGLADEKMVSAAYEHAAVPARVLAFTHEMAFALSAATLVVCRAGASTLAELTALGKPSILLPYPWHKDQHQRENGRVLAEAGAAMLLTDVREPRANSEAVLNALESCSEPSMLQAMSRAAVGLGRADAAEHVAGWLLHGAAAG